jgi:hypothetical protein
VGGKRFPALHPHPNLPPSRGKEQSDDRIQRNRDFRGYRSAMRRALQPARDTFILGPTRLFRNGADIGRIHFSERGNHASGSAPITCNVATNSNLWTVPPCPHAFPCRLLIFLKIHVHLRLAISIFKKGGDELATDSCRVRRMLQQSHPLFNHHHPSEFR